MDATLVETEYIKAVYHQQLQSIALYDTRNTLIRHIDAQLSFEDLSAALSPCARYLAIRTDISVCIIDFEAPKSRTVSVTAKGLFWCRFGVLLLGILDPLNDRVWLYKGVELVVEISVHGQIPATHADIIDDSYLVLSNAQQGQIFRLSASPNIASVSKKYKLLEELRNHEFNLSSINESIKRIGQVKHSLDILCDAPANLAELREFVMQNLAKTKASIDENIPYLSKALEFEELARNSAIIIDQLNRIYENAVLVCEWLASWDHSKFVAKSYELFEAMSSFDGSSVDCTVLQKSIYVFYENRNFAVFLTTSLKH